MRRILMWCSGTAVVVSAVSFFVGGRFARAGDAAACEPVPGAHAPEVTVSAPELRAAPLPDAPEPPTPAAAPGPPVSGAPPEQVPDAKTSWPFVADDEEAAGDRIYSKVRFLWIRPEPERSDDWVGYLSLGDSVRLKGGSRETAYVGKSKNARCHSWYAVEPMGYVCLGEDATLDPHDPDIVALRETTADARSPWPYAYGESTGTPVYLSVPEASRQASKEPGLETHLRKVQLASRLTDPEEIAAVDPVLAGVDLRPPSDPTPPFLLHLGSRGLTSTTQVVRGSTVAYTKSFQEGGRGWLLTWDRGVVPKDRVKVYPESRFHGVALTGGVELPIAFFRSEQPVYRREGDRVVPTDARWPRHGWAALTEETVEQDGVTYHVTKKDGLLCGSEGVSIARRTHELPAPIVEQTEGRKTWVDVSVLGGTLVAYEHDRPVYATLISPGRGGVPSPGVPPLDTASTPLGRFRLTGKFLTATMVSGSNKNLVHAEVPYTQNFTGPYALHGAYWHDGWGEKMSGGCVNLSPIDAKRLFTWSEPRLPAGWHAVQLATGYAGAKKRYDTATLVHLRR